MRLRLLTLPGDESERRNEGMFFLQMDSTHVLGPFYTMCFIIHDIIMMSCMISCLEK